MTSTEASAPIAVPTREIGRAGPGSFWSPETEETPELRWPMSVRVFDRMRRQDAQTQSVLRAVTFPVRAIGWSIDPAGARDQVVEELAEDLNLPIVGQAAEDRRRRLRSRDRFEWNDHLRQALLHLPFGHMFFEQQYRIVGTGSGQRARLRKLGPRMPYTIESIEVADDGGLQSIRQWGVREPIPVTQLVGYVNEREGGNWYGTSVLRSAYKHWLLKDRLLRTGTSAIDRNGMGVPIYEAASNERDLTNGHKLATGLRSGESAGAALPYGAKLRLAGVEGTVPDALPHIRYHDEQIARSVMAHVLNLGQQANAGSWALGTTFADLLSVSLNAVAGYVRDTANAHVVEDWVDVNYGEDEPAPRIVCEEIGGKTAAVMAAIVQLIQAGAVVVDKRLENTVREQLDLPPADPSAPPGPMPVPPEPAP